MIAERFDRHEHKASEIGPAELPERHASVLFADIQGFTAVAERLPPARLARWLASWLEAMAAVVRAQGGEIEQVLGDGLLAIFAGHPRATASDAAATARAMHRALLELNEGLEARGWPEIRMRIGIATGAVATSPTPFQGTATGILVGDTVNIAARLQQLDAALVPVPAGATRVLLDAATAGWLPEPGRIEPVGTVALTGRSRPIAVARLRVEPAP